MHNEYIHKKTGNHYRLVTDNFMFKDVNPETGKLDWRRGLILYETLYHNPDGRFFARTPEDFYANFEPIAEENTIPKFSQQKLVIEKELCNPTDGYTIPRPYYHVCVIDEQTGEKKEIKTFEKDIKEAARFAEHELDCGLIEIAYRENPDSFKATTPVTLESLTNNTAAFKFDFYAFKFEKENIRKIINLMTEYCMEKAENPDGDEVDFDNAYEYIKEKFIEEHKDEAVVKPMNEQ